QRYRAARGDGHVAAAEELQHRERVVGGPVQAYVAGHGGDPAQFQPGVPAAERDRERVIDARIAVEDDLPGIHGQPVACSQRTGAPSAAHRNGSSSQSQGSPSSRDSSSFSAPPASRASAAPPPWASRAMLDGAAAATVIACRSLLSGTRMSPLAMVTAENTPSAGV